MKKIKKRIYSLLEAPTGTNLTTFLVNTVIFLFIFISILSLVLETFDTIVEDFSDLLGLLETFVVIVFTIEYLLRLWTADLKYSKLSPMRARLRFAFSFLGLVDLLSILPAYLSFIAPVRYIRFIRIFRLFKTERYADSIYNILEVIKKKKQELLLSLGVVLTLMLFSSIIMYHLEHPVQPDKFQNIFSSIWWAVMTVTTIGSGDIYPVSAFGKLIGSIVAFLGIGLIAIPTGIISAGFIERNRQSQRQNRHCPHCGGILYTENADETE